MCGVAPADHWLPVAGSSPEVEERPGDYGRLVRMVSPSADFLTQYEPLRKTEGCLAPASVPQRADGQSKDAFAKSEGSRTGVEHGTGPEPWAELIS